MDEVAEVVARALAMREAREQFPDMAEKIIDSIPTIHDEERAESALQAIKDAGMVIVPRDEFKRQLDRSIELIMNIEIEAMHGDNLAVTLCSYFEDADDECEPDDSGWKESSLNAYNGIQAAIKKLFNPVHAMIEAHETQAD